VRSLVGRNPLILVGTKSDLLPRGTDGELIKQWLLQLCESHGLTVIDVQLVSSKTGAALDVAARSILTNRKGRDVFILGAANVGKSLFVQALLQEMAKRDPAAVGAQRYKPLASATPGTTLGMIELDVFSGGSKLHDTPGVHLHHRVSARLPPADVKAIAPKQPLRGQGAPVSPELLEQLAAGLRGRRLAPERGWSVFWGAFLRVDIVSAPACTRLVFWGPPAVALRGVHTAKAAAYYGAEVGRELTPPATVEAARGLGELDEKRTLKFKVVPGECTIDVAVSGLGWFSVVGVQQSGLAGEAEIRLWSPRAVELFVRKPMPVWWADFKDDTLDFVELDDDGDDFDAR
jgi:nitric-oxide synthase